MLLRILQMIAMITVVVILLLQYRINKTQLEIDTTLRQRLNTLENRFNKIEIMCPPGLAATGIRADGSVTGCALPEILIGDAKSK